MTSTRTRNPLTNLISLFLCGLLAGIVVAAAALPAAAVAGLTAKAGADTFENLPSELQTPPLPLTTKVLNDKGQYVTSLHGDQNRVNVTLSQVPESLQHAVIAIEDSRFYEHHGVDLKGILRAFVSSGSGSTQGASTLTQQYVRQDLALTATSDAARAAAVQQTLGRKLREIRYAVALEKKFNKQQILEKYLNTVYFGRGAYGVAVAAQRYFNKSVDQLTLGESALLASFIQSPGYYPLHLDKAEVRRNYVLTRMQQLGYITSAQENDGKKNKPTLNLTPLPSTCLPNGAITAQNNWGYFCDYLRIWAQQQPSLGATPDERWSAIRTGGYTIKLSLDPDMQAAAQHSVDNVGGGRGADLTQGVVFIEPGTGRIRSLAVNRTFDQAPKGAAGRALKQYNENPLLTGDPENQTTSTGYPSGSTFKMFTMLAALRQGMQLDTGFYSGQTYTTKAKGDDGEPYTVANANSNGSMNGYRDMWSGFGESVNTYFIQLEIAAKVTNVAKAARDAGISFFPGATGTNSYDSIIKGGDNPGRLSLTFGQGSDTWPLYMANAYATVAAEGKYCEPTPIQSVQGPDGKTLSLGAPNCKQVFSKGVADAATDAARCPVAQSAQAGHCGWATGGSVGNAVGRPMAGKTGSTPGNRQVWFAGFVPQLAGASFSTDTDNPFHGADNNDSPDIANYIFGPAMANAVDGMPEKGFDPPPDSLANGGVHSHAGEPANPTPSPKAGGSGGTVRPGTGGGTTQGTGHGTPTKGPGHGPTGLPPFALYNPGFTTSNGRRAKPQV
ncbi:transglycosylase domain-containing protein [Fodinicola feengrottensis]|uniref:Transglycosylase domain-containing protein n=1 Tax=Fodinicola feengrottensis TaxID=435914 RepID=A0ABN2I5W3_9ACTN